MKIKKVLTTALAVTVVGGAAIGCSKGGDSASSAAPDSSNPANSAAATTTGSASTGPKEIKINFSAEPPALDSSKATTNASFTMLNALNEGLYRIDKDGKAVPGLAADQPTISPDGLKYTIKLRDNATWSDGTPVKAADFEQAFKRTVDPNTKAQYAFMVAWIKGGNDVLAAKTPEEVKKAQDAMGVKAVDEKTLEITLDKPMNFFTQQLAFPLFFPQKADQVKQLGDTYGKDADKVIGAGPFILKEWVHEQKLVFEKNPKYWDAANVKIDKLTVNIVKDRATAVNLYETKAADITDLAGDFVKQYEGKPDVRTKNELTNAYLMFNVQGQKYLDNKKIRQALTMAINLDAHVQTVLKNGSVPSTGFVPNGTMDGNGQEYRKTAGELQPKHDPAKAKQLLQEGLQEVGLSALPSFKITTDDTEGGKKTLEFILAQWKENLGVTAVADPVPHELRVERQHNKQYEVLIALWGADYNDPMTFLDMWTTKSEFNETGWSSAQYDDLIKKATDEKDMAKRVQNFVDAEKILMDEMPVGPLYFRSRVYAVRPNIDGMFFPSYGPEWEMKWADLK